MMRLLLWRGMLAGMLGAFVAATFALAFAEPLVDAAIGFEAHHAAQALAGVADEEVVSRATQKGLGLYTSMLLYGAAFGGLLSIAFAAVRGRLSRAGPHGLSLLLGAGAFVLVALVPALKYPPNPPAVGLHDTVRLRTAAYFAMLAFSLLSAIAAGWVHRALARLAPADRLLGAMGAFAGSAAVLATLLPAVDEVPAAFPASLLWRFRLVSLATQGVFWFVSADLFGRMAQRLLARAGQELR